MKRARVKPVPKRGRMNLTESAWAEVLELRRLAGEIQSHRFEPIRFVLGHAANYTPDFEVVDADGYIEYHEVKGFWREAARVRIKTVARMFPDRLFVAVKKRTKKQGGGWEHEEIKP